MATSRHRVEVVDARHGGVIAVCHALRMGLEAVGVDSAVEAMREAIEEDGGEPVLLTDIDVIDMRKGAPTEPMADDVVAWKAHAETLLAVEQDITDRGGVFTHANTARYLLAAIERIGRAVPSKPTASDVACSYIIGRLAEDADLAWIIGYGTQTLALLCAAEAAHTGEDVDAVKARRSKPARGKRTRFAFDEIERAIGKTAETFVPIASVSRLEAVVESLFAVAAEKGKP